MEALSRPSSKPYLSEMCILRDRITKVEGKFETLSDRLDRKLSQNIDTLHWRASTLERVSSMETYFSSRLSRLEGRVSYILLSKSPDTSSDVAHSLANIERRLEDLTAAVEQVSVLKVASPDGGHQDVQTIQRQVLCEIQTDGGGWTVIQRRAAGDVDFYRNWTAYREGFGSLTGDFWLGNEATYNLTDTYPYELRNDFRVNGQRSLLSTRRLGSKSSQTSIVSDWVPTQAPLGKSQAMVCLTAIINNSLHLIVIMMRTGRTVPYIFMELGGITLVLTLTSMVYGSKKLRKPPNADTQYSLCQYEYLDHWVFTLFCLVVGSTSCTGLPTPGGHGS
ncbi:hypothetical protein RRG08_012019 [Elysia crispata]|uniref:Fibrinogen C-terminal domain-containing protein n=1 Tax=Elysia crispata TaxID=231223 RepID=A0AAE0ZX85_9GAST|nr:hypothetical protein RRG08_012019 [Elysia crispata]